MRLIRGLGLSYGKKSRYQISVISDKEGRDGKRDRYIYTKERRKRFTAADSKAELQISKPGSFTRLLELMTSSLSGKRVAQGRLLASLNLGHFSRIFKIKEVQHFDSHSLPEKDLKELNSPVLTHLYQLHKSKVNVLNASSGLKHKKINLR